MAKSPDAFVYNATLERIVDGDTFDCCLDLGFDVRYCGRIRLLGIDTPESRTRNLVEKVYGLLSKKHLKEFSPDLMELKTNIPSIKIKEVARLFANTKKGIIFWGMGVSQHIHGTDNARCLISLALMTGNVGRRGAGLHPLRGQNNVQGASDAGLIPMM